MRERLTDGSCDLLIVDGIVVDGTGADRIRADVAVSNGRITALGDLSNIQAAERLDAGGNIVAPGFVDAHTHDDRLVLSSPDMTPKISQGVTTVIAGNCGVSLAPLTGLDPPPPLNLLGGKDWYRFENMAAYFDAVEKDPPATNIAMLTGHSTLRAGVMETLDRAATPAEIEVMGERLVEALDAGSIGMSTGLAYAPAAAAPTDEVVALAAHLAPRGGVYTTHMRDEGAGLVDSVRETLEIGRRAEVPVVISHHKSSGRNNWGRTRETLKLIARARETQTVNLDVYPYTASSTVLIANWVTEAERVLVTWSEAHPECAGRDLAEIATEWGCSEETAADKLQPAGAIYYQMDEGDLQRILRFNDAMIGSDGLPHDLHPHPRLWGTFPRVLGHYQRELQLFPLEEAIRRMTGVPAQVFGLQDRGTIQVGAAADFTVFDPATIIDEADYSEPRRAATGITRVIVNGVIVWDGDWTGQRPGQLLRRPGANQSS
jgi:N-acyl-D-amino-acid deacylase